MTTTVSSNREHRANKDSTAKGKAIIEIVRSRSKVRRAYEAGRAAFRQAQAEFGIEGPELPPGPPQMVPGIQAAGFVASRVVGMENTAPGTRAQAAKFIDTYL